MKKFNADALRIAVIGATTRHADREPEAVVWDIGYADALEKAATMGDRTMLRKMLRAGRPIHPAMLPALAYVLDQADLPKRDGRPRALTSQQKKFVAAAVQSLRTDKTGYEEARARVADHFRIKPSTVKRAYEELVPVADRPRKTKAGS